jgi:hypothetical protein
MTAVGGRSSRTARPWWRHLLIVANALDRPHDRIMAPHREERDVHRLGDRDHLESRKDLLELLDRPRASSNAAVAHEANGLVGRPGDRYPSAYVRQVTLVPAHDTWPSRGDPCSGGSKLAWAVALEWPANVLLKPLPSGIAKPKAIGPRSPIALKTVNRQIWAAES